MGGLFMGPNGPLGAHGARGALWAPRPQWAICAHRALWANRAQAGRRRPPALNRLGMFLGVRFWNHKANRHVNEASPNSNDKYCMPRL